MQNSASSNDYQNVVRNGCTLLTDLLAQLVNLIVILNKEIEYVEDKEAEENSTAKTQGSPISVRGMKTSIVMLQFSVLEALANFISVLALKSSEEIAGSPPVINRLTQIEVDFLLEQRTYLEMGSGNLKVSSGAYSPTLDKLSLVPFLLGKIYNQPFRIDKGSNGWKKIQRLKEIRDKLTHFKFDGELWATHEAIQLDLDNIKPSIVISSNDLFIGCAAIHWYLQQVESVLKNIYGNDHKPLLFNFKSLRVLSYLTLLNLYKNCGISDKTFNRDYPNQIMLSSIHSPK